MALSKTETGNTTGCKKRKELHLDVPVGIANQPKLIQNKKELKAERDTLLWRFKQYVCALRNSGGGILWVQMKDVDPTDRCLEYLNELVDDRLNKMISDGSLFARTCQKDWASDYGSNSGLIRYEVFPADCIETLDYNTKESLDNCIIDVSSSKIFKILREGLRFEFTKPTFRGLSENMQESRNVEVKSLVCNETLSDSTPDLIEHIWDHLKLGYYITAFSKLDGGGSFYLGINESEGPYWYKSKSFTQRGFRFPKSHHDDFITSLKTKARNETIVMVTEKGTFGSRDLIEVKFHPDDEFNELYVLEIAVAAVEDLVFYDNEGPESYEVLNGEIRRISKENWIIRQQAMTMFNDADPEKNESRDSTACREERKEEHEELERLNESELLDKCREFEKDLEHERAENMKLRKDLASKQTEDELNWVLDMVSLSELSEDSGHGSDSYSLVSGWSGSTSDNVRVWDVKGASSGQGSSKGLLNRLRDIISNRGQKRKGMLPTYLLEAGPVFVITDANKTSPMFLQCSKQQMDKRSMNMDVYSLSEDGSLLTSSAVPIQDIAEHKSTSGFRFHTYRGTCSTSCFPPSPTTSLPNASIQYWETRIEGEIGKNVNPSEPLADVGVGAQNGIDTETRLHKQTQSWCICVAVCDTHPKGICSQVWWNGDLVKCVSQANAYSINRTFGLLLDLAKEKIVFIDLDRGTVLHKFSQRFANLFCPMFGISPHAGENRMKIRLISGSDIVLTAEKQQLIHSCMQ